MCLNNGYLQDHNSKSTNTSKAGLVYLVIAISVIVLLILILILCVKFHNARKGYHNIITECEVAVN